MKNFTRLICVFLCCLAGACAISESSKESAWSKTYTAVTTDGVSIYGEPYFGELGKRAPLVLLFHQGGSNGRGEYAPIAQWLNELGFRAIAWDQRAGGALFGNDNRTLAGLPDNAPSDYCDAYADLEAALAFVINEELADRVVVWGSSYSGALVFQLAAKEPEHVAGVIAFSPASGGPLKECRARRWVGVINAPMFALRPYTEMERESSKEQQEILTDAGVKFFVVKNGVHGSSMLLDERTESDMGRARSVVADWLYSLDADGRFR